MFVEDMSRNKCFFPGFEYHMFYVLYQFVPICWLSFILPSNFPSFQWLWHIATRCKLHSQLQHKSKLRTLAGLLQCYSIQSPRWLLLPRVSGTRHGSQHAVMVLQRVQLRQTRATPRAPGINRPQRCHQVPDGNSTAAGVQREQHSVQKIMTAALDRLEEDH
jgi:hypothetical protein